MQTQRQWRVALFTYSLQVNKTTIFIISEHSSEFRSLLRIRTHDVLKEANIVRLVADLLGIKENLVVLAQFSKAKDNLEINGRYLEDTFCLYMNTFNALMISLPCGVHWREDRQKVPV
jgi:hypothetical protein